MYGLRFILIAIYVKMYVQGFNVQDIVLSPSQVHPAIVKTFENAVAKLFCGSLEPVHWTYWTNSFLYRNKSRKIPGEHEIGSYSITLKNLSINDTGLYYCGGTAWDGVRTYSFWKPVYVYVVEEAQVREAVPNIIHGSSGDSATLMCGSTSPVEWFSANLNSQETYELENNTYTLVLKNLTEEHTGVYVCQGHDNYGFSFKKRIEIYVDTNFNVIIEQ